MPETVFQVDQREGDLIATNGEFCAVYFKPAVSSGTDFEKKDGNRLE
jgi:hypothetical protein